MVYICKHPRWILASVPALKGGPWKLQHKQEKNCGLNYGSNKPQRRIITQSYKTVVHPGLAETPGLVESMRTTSGIATGNGKRHNWFGCRRPIKEPTASGDGQRKKKVQGGHSVGGPVASEPIPAWTERRTGVSVRSVVESLKRQNRITSRR